MKAKYGQVALLLAVIVAVSLGLTALCGVQRVGRDDGRLSVVASFYPMYTATLRVVGDSDGVAVRCLTQPTAGCLHDHQLSPAERATLEEAEVLILNGAGAEAFLDPVLPQLTATAVDTSAGLAFAEEHHQHEGHTHPANEHVWVDPRCYIEQVKVICDALCAADPANAVVYQRNAQQYVDEIEQVATELSAAAAALGLEQALLFHDSMAYLAESLGLDVLGTLPIGEDEGFSAAEVADVADRLAGQAVVFLYDDQYPVQMTQLTAYAERSAVVSFSSAVMPVADVADEDTWLHAMRQNITQLQEAAV